MLDLRTARLSVEDFYQRIYWQAPTAITYSTPDYTLTYSGVAWLHSLNQLWLHRVDRLDDNLLRKTADFFRPYEAEYTIIITECETARWIQWLAERHYVERATNPIYGLHGLPRPRYIHRDVEIVRACAEHQQELLEVLYSAFFMGPEVGRCAMRPEHFADPTIRHYLAYINGEAAACATVILNDGIAGVWNVATLRPFRRQGIAAAILMRALVDAAADGCSDSVLVASPMGRPLYQQMGYELLGASLFYGPGD